MLRKAIRTNEFVVAMFIVVVSVGVGVDNRSFFSIANVFDLLRSLTVSGILALGVLLVLISGGVDVSFPAIAAASSYVAVKVLNDQGFQGSAAIVYLIAIPIGLICGFINATFISWFRLPALIVTLGTSSIYYGFVLFFVGSQMLFNLPQGMADYRTMSLVTVSDPRVGTSSLHPSILILVGAALAVWFLLRYTMIGRGVYAIGGNREVAERSGLNTRLIEYTFYGVVGVLAAVAGVTQVALYRNANPAALMGTELDVIAAVVLGGTAITGGRGSVVGAMLGLLLITILKSSLVMVGIPAEWQRVVIGIALVIGVSVPAIRTVRANQRLIAVSAH